MKINSNLFFQIKKLFEVKVNESALVNVNKDRCSLKVNTLWCKLIYAIVKVSKNCECSVSVVTIWKSAYWGPVWKLLYGPAKNPFI